jgi:hypothetical protein
MEENEPGFYSAVEKEILILAESIRNLIERTNMEDVNKGMAESILTQLNTDLENIRRHAFLRHKIKYQPLPETAVLPEHLKDITANEIEDIYERIEAVYFSLIKFEQSVK